MTPNARLCFLIPLVVAIGGLAALLAMGLYGWPGEVGASGRSFNEAPRNGLIKQPANAYSNAGFLLVGLWAGWQARRDVAAVKASDWNNRLVTTVGYPVALATCSVLIGLGSFALHASMTPWAAELDHLAMHVWAGWCVAFSTSRLLRLGDRVFYAIWASIGLALLVRLGLGRPHTVQGSTLFGAMIALTVTIELLGRLRNRHLSRLDTPLMAWGVGVFLTADLFRRADPFCSATSVWQAHAAWHVLCAGSTLFVYLYARSERSIRTAECEPRHTPA